MPACWFHVRNNLETAPGPIFVDTWSLHAIEFVHASRLYLALKLIMAALRVARRSQA